MPSSSNAEQSGPITIKKYANRRLYNTATSSYVTLDHLCQMVKDGVDFAVFDAKSGDDITRTGADPDHRRGGGQGPPTCLPINFLQPADQLLWRFNMQWMVPQLPGSR